MSNSRWEDIFLHLKSKGFEVYSPGIKVGECINPYIVIKNDGSNRHMSGNRYGSGISTNDDLYAVMCYIPKQNYSKLEPMIQSVLKAMKELEPMIKPVGSQTPSYYDDAVKAHMVSIAYKNYKKMF